MSTLAVAIALFIPIGAATSPRSIAGLKSGDVMGGRFLGGDAAGRTCCIPKVGDGCADRKARARQAANICTSEQQSGTCNDRFSTICTNLARAGEKYQRG